jgi:hypothetical protein
MTKGNTGQVMACINNLVLGILVGECQEIVHCFTKCQAKVEMSLFLQSRDVPFFGNTCRIRRACGKVVSALLSTFP